MNQTLVLTVKVAQSIERANVAAALAQLAQLGIDVLHVDTDVFRGTVEEWRLVATSAATATAARLERAVPRVVPAPAPSAPTRGKLSPADVVRAKEMLAGEELSQKQIAQVLGVSRSTIALIAQGRIHRDAIAPVRAIRNGARRPRKKAA